MTSLRIIQSHVLAGLWLVLAILAAPPESSGQVAKVAVTTDASGSRLTVNGKEFMVRGMNWDYFPIGTTYTYSLWTQPDDVIKDALDREMRLLKGMGVNAIRQYVGVTPRWVQYIYEQYGIYTILNHSFGRYGVTIGGAYIQNTDYADPRTRAVLLSEVTQMVEDFQNTPGVLMWLLGNENNYGLFWSGAETEDIPVGETVESVRARHMYALFNEGVKAIKERDTQRPVAMANGDLLFIDIIAEEMKDLDIFGTNMYRGVSFTDAFVKVKEKLNLPILFTEFGADAFNAKEAREDQLMQARYVLGNWQEIFEHSYGKGLTGISIGGLTFQFSDGWWKHGQESDLDVHDITASWSNGGYVEDHVEGENNMNEEWFGICAKGPTNVRGLYDLYPRAAYYALKKAYTLDPYAPGVDLATIRSHFSSIEPMDFVLAARSDQASLAVEHLQRIRVSGLRLEMSTFNTGGNRITTPQVPVEGRTSQPAFRGFDHMQSFYVDVEGKPAPNVVGKVSINVLGNVPENPIDEIFYENRGRGRTVLTNTEPLQLRGIERVKVHAASLKWEDRWFSLNGFFRSGHYHWGYEGDFFGLYPEANYGSNIDIYNGEAPVGVEVAGKKSLEGLKIAFGPELWWGANPALIFKYRRSVGQFQFTGMFQEDFSRQAATVSSFAVPVPPTRKATLHAATTVGPFGVEIGGIWSGSTKKGETFQIAEGSTNNYRILLDRIKASDAFGGKVKLTYSRGQINWYAQAAAMGLVADGGATMTQTFTGWRLKDAGTGNQTNVLTGVALTFGDWQIAPNFLWQKPIVGPIPGDVPAPGRPRNILADPFAVRWNRETTAGELLVTYDPTPATWMYAWDSDMREDAKLAASVGVVFRHHPTTRDASIGILGDGRTTFAFPGAPPARDHWETHARIVSKLSSGTGFIANLFAGTAEANGSDPRLIHRYGGDIRFVTGSYKIVTSVKVNDWGPYDYHRDFNLTFPLQLGADISTVVGTPTWWDVAATRLGVRLTWRSLDQYSPRYNPATRVDPTGKEVPFPAAPGAKQGNEWEIRTYVHLNIGT